MRLRREAEESRQRATRSELEVIRLTRLCDAKGLDVKALKSALKNRDTQLAAAGERIKELEGELSRCGAREQKAAGGMELVPLGV